MDRDIKDPLLFILVTILSPLFFTEGTNPKLARLAALQTIEAYHAESRADLITIAQIIAFGLAALGSLGMSMADDLSVTGVLKLRAAATALSRAGERHRANLEKDRNDRAELQAFTAAAAAAAPTPPQPEAPAAITPEPEKPAAQPQRIASAPTTAASLPNLPPPVRPQPSMRAAALGSTAMEFVAGLSATAGPR